MKFTFVNKSSCCGGGTTTLQSTGYPVDAANPTASLTQALDRFHVNYRVAPTGVIMTDEELSIMQRGLTATDFTVTNGVLQLRKLPISLVKAMV